MKKSKKVLILTASVAGLLSLASCGEVTSKGNILISYKDTKGTKINYTAEELFAKYTKSSRNSNSAYYDAIYDVMVRQWFELEENEIYKNECDKNANIQLEALKEKADQNHDDNGTLYSDEWENILDSELSDLAEDKRTTKELILKLQLDEYKEKLQDIFYDQFKSWKKGDTAQAQNNLFWGDNGYLKEKLPYHVKHILVNVDASSGKYYDAEISESNVKDLYSAISQLANGTNFGLVAQLISDDAASAETYGDLGIMDTSTSYVNEFKLGLYAFDTYFNTDEEISKSLQSDENPFSIPEEEGNYVKSLGIASIPYGAIVKMNELKDVTKDSNGKQVNDGDSTYYPRNILFNKYFNNRNLAFITPDDISGENPTAYYEDDLLNTHYSDLDNVTGKWTNGNENPTYSAMKGFQEITLKTYDSNGNQTGTEKRKVLCDNAGNPIIVVRAGSSSYQGIHFITVERSALAETQDGVSLNEYYASENPLTSSGTVNNNFPTDDNGNLKKTFVNSYEMSYEKYTERVNTIKNNVKDFDKNYEMRIYEWLEENLNIEYNEVDGVNLGDKIDEYIATARYTTAYDERTSNTDTWESFIELLEVQQSQRKTKLIPETCALHFKDGYKGHSDKVVEEACYHEK